MTDAARRLVERVTALPGYSSAVGTRVLEVAPGAVAMALDHQPDLLQFNGFFHGGVIAGLADHAAGAAVTTALPPGRIAVTVDLHVHYLAPANGASITARAKAIQVGASLSVATVEISTERDGVAVACGFCTATLRSVEMPKG